MGTTGSGIYVIAPGMPVPEIPSRLAIGRGCGVGMTFVILPGVGASDISIDVEMDGEESSVSIFGVYVCGGDDALNLSVNLEHKVPHCRSVQIFKGLAAGRARVDFHGKITVVPDAQGTDASQENHGILLSGDARVGTSPQLEIYADDVKCSHGATIGRLNEEEQFYMRSRGVPLAEARTLQILSFLSPALGNVGDERARRQLLGTIGKAVRGML